MKTMLEAGKEYTFQNEKGETDYHVILPEGDYLLVSAGVEYGTNVSKFDHENILRKQDDILRFRAYWPNGHKRWYEKPGTNFLFAVHKSKIFMIHERGYSYVPLEIGGVRYNLSCSGGTKDGWTDYVCQGCSVGVFRSKKNLKNLADNSFKPDDLSLGPVPAMDEREREEFRRLCAYHDTKSKLKEGDKVVLGYGYHIEESKGPFLIVRKDKRKRHFICSGGIGYPNFKIYYKHINWEKTAEVNGVALVS